MGARERLRVGRDDVLLRGTLRPLRDVEVVARGNCPWDEGTYWCACAVRQGHFEMLKWLRENGCPWNEHTCMEMAGGHLEILQWARENGCPWDTLTCADAARGGHLEVLKWARERLPVGHVDVLVRGVATSRC